MPAAPRPIRAVSASHGEFLRALRRASVKPNCAAACTQRGQHIVAVAAPGDVAPAIAALLLLERHHVGHHLAGMGQLGQAVDHGDGGVGGQLVAPSRGRAGGSSPHRHSATARAPCRRWSPRAPAASPCRSASASCRPAAASPRRTRCACGWTACRRSSPARVPSSGSVGIGHALGQPYARALRLRASAMMRLAAWRRRDRDRSRKCFGACLFKRARSLLPPLSVRSRSLPRPSCPTVPRLRALGLRR